jgi:GNAT superfamily N-acetyltransferase
MAETIVSKSGLAIEYGPAVAADAEAIQALRGNNWMEYARTPQEWLWMESEVIQYCGDEGIQRERQRIELAGLTSESIFYFRVAKLGGTLVGYVAGLFEAGREPNMQEVTALHVAYDRRGEGIGGHLLKAFLRDGDHPMSTMLEVVAHAPAVGFYRVHGFRVSDRLAEPWGPFDTLRLERSGDAQ